MSKLILVLLSAYLLLTLIERSFGLCECDDCGGKLHFECRDHKHHVNVYKCETCGKEWCC